MTCLECGHLQTRHSKMNVLNEASCTFEGCTCTGFREAAAPQFMNAPHMGFAKMHAELGRAVANLSPEDTVFVCIQRNAKSPHPQVMYVSYSAMPNPLNLVISLIAQWISGVCMPGMKFETEEEQ